jgi:hypothetical protein
MHRPTRLLLIAQVLAGLAAAQTRYLTGTSVKPASCPDGLQALGLTSPPKSVELRLHYDSLADSSIATYARPYASFILQPRDGVNMITGIVHFAHRPPSSLAALELDLLVHSPSARTPDERVLNFQVDDSAHVAIGLAGAYPSVAVGGIGVNEHIIAMVSPPDVLQLLRGRKIRGSLGTTTFGVSDQDRDGLRALVMYVHCGAR